MKIAILGAESTGKTALAMKLATHLRQRGDQVDLVPEVLRAWCDREGRTPRADEQMGIAREQARCADNASAPWVIADTTPIMIAVYSDMLFADQSLYPMALAHQRSYDLTLLTGLDLPWVADGLQRDGPHVREPVDALVRAALARADVPFRVVYGSGPERLDNALNAINSIANNEDPARTSSQLTSKNRKWTWVCDKCSDPDCEHRLFTERLSLAAAAGPRR